MFRRALLTMTLALLVGLPPILLTVEPATAAVPNGFIDRLVTSVNQPTALAFTPDGRMLITTKAGKLRVHQHGKQGTTQALDISGKICSNAERGLLGVAVDPNFKSNHYIYVYYTRNKHGVCPEKEPANPENPVNRVSRFALVGDTVDRSSEKVLIDNIPSPNGNHNAGDLHFGKDGYLYVSVGDGGCDYMGDSGCGGENDAARDRHVLLGKILRITRSGGIPPDNPYTGPNSDRCNVNGKTEPGKNCQETFARGLRNPFRMAFDRNAASTRFFINDVGQDVWEEINRGSRGADYGWNCREATRVNSTSGKCDPTPPGLVYPIYQYSQNTGCGSITGGAFVPNGVWRASYDKAYLFGDFKCDKIFKLTLKSGGGFTKTVFAKELANSPVAMGFDPYHESRGLYYTTLTFPNGGEVRRIVYTGAN